MRDKIEGKGELRNQEEELMKLAKEIRYLKDINDEKEIEPENISRQNEEAMSKLETAF